MARCAFFVAGLVKTATNHPKRDHRIAHGDSPPAPVSHIGHQRDVQLVEAKGSSRAVGIENKIMPRISPVSTSTDATVTAVLEDMKARRGKAPNFMATLAQSPAAFNGYMALSKALMRGRLTPRQRESLALAIGQTNACQYCLSAHTASGKMAGLSDIDILKARAGNSDNPLDNAVLTFATKLVHQKGLLSDGDIAAAREAGIDESLMLEIVAYVALNTLTNYTNRLAGTEIDFPVVPPAA